MRILVLAGTTQAREVIAHLHAHDSHCVLGGGGTIARGFGRANPYWRVWRGAGAGGLYHAGAD